MNPIRFLPALALATLALGSGLAFAQAGTGNLYSVTSKMEVVGMPFQMPPQTVEVCGPKNQSDERMIPHDENCTVSDFRVNGNRSTFSMTCRGENAMTATGEFERLPNEGYRGTMRMQGNMEGEPMEMRMTFEGRRIRDCDYATESPEAQGREMMARSCTEMLSAPGYPVMLHAQFIGREAMCASDKPKFCARVTPLATDLRALSDAIDLENRARGAGNQSSGLWEALQGCGLARQAVMTQACTAAERTKDYGFASAHCPDVVPRLCTSADPRTAPDFLARSCPVQAEAAARQHCVRRGFTADRSSPYTRFCDLYTAQRLRGGDAGSDAGGDAPANGRPASEPAAPAAPATQDPPRRSLRDRLRDVIGG